VTIARDGTGTGLIEAGNTTSYGGTFTTNNDRHLVIRGDWIGVAPNTPTDSGSGSWTLRVKTHTAGGIGTYVAYSENRASITTFTVTFASGTYTRLALDQYSGVKTTGSYDAELLAEASAGNTSLASGNFTIGDANGLIIGVGASDDSGISGPWASTGTGWSAVRSIADNVNGGSAEFADLIAVGSTGPYSRTWVCPGVNSPFSSQLVSFLGQSAPVPTYANTPRDDELIALGSVLGPFSWVKPQSWF